MNPFLRASIELEHPFAFGAFFCAVFALGSSCSSDPSPGLGMDLGTGGVFEASGGAEHQGTGAAPSGGNSTSGGSSASGGNNASGGDTQAGTGGESVAMPGGEVRSAGCETSAPLSEGEHTFTLEGKERRFIVRLPENYNPAEPQPLVFALHPNGSGSGYWDSTHTGDGRAAREFFKDKAILVVTEAIGGNWRDYGQDESTFDARLEEELLYFNHLFAETKAGLCVNENQIFSIGFSGGGSFSGVLACRRSDVRGFAAGGAVIYFKAEDCIQSSAAWVTIGDGEQSDLRSAFRDYFRDAAGCQETSATGAPETCANYEGCEETTPVTFCSHPAGHELPDFFLTSSWSLFESLD